MPAAETKRSVAGASERASRSSRSLPAGSNGADERESALANTGAAERLKTVGLKATAPRLKVLQVLHQHERRHLTADDVHRRMVEQNGDVGLATVYRVLAQLTDVGIVSRSVFESNRAVYEVQQGERHDHLVCLECGRVDEFVDEVIARRKRTVSDQSGYAIAHHQLALYGFCPDCRDPSKASARGAR